MSTWLATTTTSTQLVNGGHLDLRRMVRGVVGPDDREIVAVPLSSGGSAGALNLCIYALAAGKAVVLQNIGLAGGAENVLITKERLVVYTAHPIQNDHNCCPSAADMNTYAMRHGQLVLERQVIVPSLAVPGSQTSGDGTSLTTETPWPPWHDGDVAAWCEPPPATNSH